MPVPSHVQTALNHFAVQVAVLFGLLTLLAIQVSTSGWLTSADRPVTDWLVSHRTPALTTVVRMVTDVGGPPEVAVVACAAAAWLVYRRRSPEPAAVLIGTVLLAGLASTLLKRAVARQRPPVALHLVTETNYSFPSGHATGTAALVAALAVVRLIPWLAAAGVTAVVALTRLYLGVHWLSDVIGGVLLGLAVALLCAGVAQLVSRRLVTQRAPRLASAHPRRS
jgi:undecaprenyl-diphosphatase